MARRRIGSQILARTLRFQPGFAYLVKMLEVEYSRKHSIPFATGKVAHKIAAAADTEPMKQRLACFDLQVTAFE